MAATHGEWRFRLSLIGLFAGLALLLAAVALFGLIRYTASQRRGEIGLRMALGASAKDILWLIVGEGAGMAAWGIGPGLAGALVVGQVLRTMLFGVGGIGDDRLSPAPAAAAGLGKIPGGIRARGALAAYQFVIHQRDAVVLPALYRADCASGLGGLRTSSALTTLLPEPGSAPAVA